MKNSFLKNTGLFSVLFIFFSFFIWGKCYAQNWLTAGNAASGGEVLGTTTNFPLSLITGASGPNTRMTIDPTGKVGIGITSPDELLHLYSLSTNGDKTVLRLQSATNTDGFGKDQIEFWSNSDASSNLWRPALMFSTDFGGFRGGLAFAINGNGSTQKTNIIEKMRIVNEGVGINTSTPSEALDVVGNVKFSGALMPNNLPGSTNDILVSRGSSTPPVWTSPSSIAWLLGGNNGTSFGTNFVGTTDLVALMFRTNNLERMSLLSNGSVRIGTKTGGVGITPIPGAQLPPSGNGLIFSGGVSVSPIFDLDNSDPLWIARNNISEDLSELRIVLGDNGTTTMNSTADDFASFGAEDVSSGNEFVPRVRVQATGEMGVGTIPADNTGPHIAPRPWIPQNRVDIERAGRALGPAPIFPFLNQDGTTMFTRDPTSGLRLSDFAGTPLQQSAMAFNSNDLVLSVNTNGDVILTHSCCKPTGEFPPPLNDDTNNIKRIDQQDMEISELKERVNKLELLLESVNKLGVLKADNNNNGNPTTIAFYQNDPNPFNTSTTINYILPNFLTNAKLIIYEMSSGDEIKRFDLTQPGKGSVVFDAHNIPSGTYSYRIISDQAATEFKKMVVVK